MSVTATSPEATVLSPDELIEQLEGLRAEFYKDHPYRVRRIESKDEFPRLAAGKRRAHAGGDINHRFEGERYLNCPVKSVRRKQLRKLVDEGGETSVGGKNVAHPLLARWESYAFGLTEEEVDRLEKSDCDPTVLIWHGWHVARDRFSHFGVAIGSGLVGEGENKLFSSQQLEAVEQDRARFADWGVEDPDRALLNRYVHAGIDVEHADFNEQVIRDYCTTPELQQQIRQIFTLRLQQRAAIR